MIPRRAAAVLLGAAGLFFLSMAPAAAGSVDALVRTPAGQAVADAAVVLEPLAPAHAHARPGARATIEQRGSEFLPYVTVVQAGTAIDFPNNDTTRHHVYSFSAPKRFEIKLYAGKPTQPIVFDQPGEVVIGCNIHDWMEAYVLVVESPYFARTGADGRAAIANVPPGRYRLRLWHPLLNAEAAPREVDVAAAGSPPVRLTLALDVKPRQARAHTLDPAGY